MKKCFLFVIIAVFLINFLSAGGLVKVCIDNTAPSAPSNLSVIVGDSGQEVILNWESATDVPDCSGIAYYVVLRNGVIIAEPITALTYTDTNISYGNYSYAVYAVDKVAHMGGQAIKNDVVLIEIIIDNGDSGGGNNRHRNNGTAINLTVLGGEAANSYVCKENWECGEWSKCIDSKQTRICIDQNECGTDIETPEMSQTCEKSASFLTGAVTGIGNFVTTTLGAVTASLIFLILGAGIIIIIRKKKKKIVE